MKRLLFASPHCLFDLGSGSAITTHDMLDILAERGFSCEAFCASKFDLPEGPVLEQTLTNLRVPFRTVPIKLGTQMHHVIFARSRNIPVTLFPSKTPIPGQ